MNSVNFGPYLKGLEKVVKLLLMEGIKIVPVSMSNQIVLGA